MKNPHSGQNCDRKSNVLRWISTIFPHFIGFPGSSAPISGRKTPCECLVYCANQAFALVGIPSNGISANGSRSGSCLSSESARRSWLWVPTHGKNRVAPERFFDESLDVMAYLSHYTSMRYAIYNGRDGQSGNTFPAKPSHGEVSKGGGQLPLPSQEAVILNRKLRSHVVV